jgi:hypothetical protein
VRPALEALEDRTLPSTATTLGLGEQVRGVFNQAAAVNLAPKGKAVAGHGVRKQAQSRRKPELRSVTALDDQTLLLQFTKNLGKSADRVSSYDIPGLTVLKAARVRDARTVKLTTSPQSDTAYKLTLNNLRAKDGRAVTVPAAAATFQGLDTTPPRVTGAISTSNTKVLVSFSEPMSDAALNPAFYSIKQTTLNPEAGTLRVLGTRPGEDASKPQFVNGDRRLVELTTSSQNELAYTLTAFNLTDLVGNPFGPPTISGSQRIDPAQATFTGTPPSGDELVDTDGDGLTDNDEMRGWQVTVTPSNGVPQTRWVTSNPFNVDTDGEGFTDNVEAQLRLDPRDADSDDDLLTDWQEYTEIYSDHLRADSDGDGLDDGTEFYGILSSPLFADTDGDQIPDGLEISLGGVRNSSVADLPRPEITVGNVNLQLDVRFTETNNRESRDLGTESFRSTLATAHTTTTTFSDTLNLEGHIGFRVGEDQGGDSKFVEGGFTVGYTYNWTGETADETRREYEKSFQTEREVTRGFSVERSVQGASMQVAIDLNNLSDLAYRVKNLQVTAFIQDPLDHARLTPIATLVPDFEPEDGFTLGPLVANHGPIIFSNTTIIPSLVESLMANSTGLIFRISNYDIVAENGRNFAFASQEVVERTGAVRIDFGGAGKLLAEVNGEDFDETNPPRQAEIHRVATSSGRAIADTNEDTKIDEDDRRVTFDPAGKEVGITLHSALKFIGLTRYDESVTPTSSLTQEEQLNSYSTIRVGGLDRIYRIRDIANDAINDKYWEILTPQGILRDVNLDTLILNAGKTISLNFVQDLDQDGLPADVEYFLRTSDSPELTGSAPLETSTDHDAVLFSNDPNLATGSLVHVSATGGGLTAGTHYYVRNLYLADSSIFPPGSYVFYSSAADAIAGTAEGHIDLTGPITAVVGVPRGRDTDKDGLDDRFESLIGWTVTTPQRTYQVYSSPNRADSNFDNPKAGVDSDADDQFDRDEYDGSDLNAAPAGWNDTNNNGLRDAGEVFQDGPSDFVLDPIRNDTDGDGIDDATEIIGFRITRITNGESFLVDPTNPLSPFSDSDTFSDGFERLVGLDPNDGADTDEDGDGLPDPVERDGWAVGKDVLVGVDLTRGGVPDRTIEWQDLVWFQTSDPNFATGTPVRVSATGGGLTAGRVYFVRNAGVGFYYFHTSEADAHLFTNPVDLTGTITASVNPLISVRGVEGVSSAPYQAGPVTQRTATSRTDSVDSDGDGLTDYEEYFLKTDPSSNDTDGDGINDRTEHLGYTLGHKVGDLDLGIIKTDPLDADTDNDKRSDGAEAELVDIELNRWAVRVAGLAPYRVYSNPLVADADFDGVVDGDELNFGSNPTYRTDPNNGNTDGDTRDDGQEFNAGTNPLIEDFQVTVFVNAITVLEDGDNEGNTTAAGEFMFQLGVRKPDVNGAAGLSSTFTPVVTESIALTSPFNFVYTGNSQVEPYLPVGPNADLDGIQVNNGDFLNFARYLPTANRSISFGMTANQSFALEGIVAEWDGGEKYSYTYLGGIDGVGATSSLRSNSLSRPIFTGTELLASASPFIDVTMTYTSIHYVTKNGGEGSIAGQVTFTIFVN